MNEDQQNSVELTQKAQAAFQAGQHLVAIELLEAAVTLAPEDPAPAILLIELYEKMGEFDLALSNVELAISQNPDDLNLLTRRAQLAIQVNNNEVAIASLIQAV